MAATFTVLLFFMMLYSARVCADLYVNDPPTGRVCSGGQPCTISWVDDGVAPLLDAIKICYVALYNGNQILIQEITPVDVSTARSLTFTPSPNAGPNSDTYYVNFTSVNPVNNNPYHQYTSFFTINNMTGSFDSPVPSITSPIPIPSSLLTPPSTSTSTPPTTTPSGMSTSRISSTATHLSTPSPTPTSESPGTNSALNSRPRSPLLTIVATSMLFFAIFELQ
ncbi:hypothetical protein BJ322DRAFT_602236 [Thelephora terrestris]|uniref:Yeast cell wall synthesis Kre9/Knh1-like N-terminal domain-containing protein n=1 Tax=Thelephora terrestris TaxID=56493 RepID=A0A9P6HLP3_9AGAM|nr:hypothetical protein BJ322DRAFT_602236 [Thelephora terrestris]